MRAAEILNLTSIFLRTIEVQKVLTLFDELSCGKFMLNFPEWDFFLQRAGCIADSFIIFCDLDGTSC